jgi:hypothetical protein
VAKIVIQKTTSISIGKHRYKYLYHLITAVRIRPQTLPSPVRVALLHNKLRVGVVRQSHSPSSGSLHPLNSEPSFSIVRDSVLSCQTLASWRKILTSLLRHIHIPIHILIHIPIRTRPRAMILRRGKRQSHPNFHLDLSHPRRLPRTGNLTIYSPKRV